MQHELPERIPGQAYTCKTLEIIPKIPKKTLRRSSMSYGAVSSPGFSAHPNLSRVVLPWNGTSPRSAVLIFFQNGQGLRFAVIAFQLWGGIPLSCTGFELAAGRSLLVSKFCFEVVSPVYLPQISNKSTSAVDKANAK